MIGQHYELWVAQKRGDSEPIVGMVIGWEAPQSDAEPLGVEHLAPVFVTEGGKTGESSVFVAAHPYVVAVTRERAVQGLQGQAEPRREVRSEETEREERRRRWDAAAEVARDSAVGGELASLQAAVVDRLRPALPKLAGVAGEAEWKLVAPRHVLVTVHQRTPVLDALPEWDEELITHAKAVLGEGWIVTVNKPGRVYRRR